jgi:two-component system sensor histidine kinase VicK
LTDQSYGITPSIATTEILYGVENAVGRGVKFMQNAKEIMDLFGDKYGPSIIMTFDVYKDNYIAARQRGCKLRLITEITSDNIHYCKELMKIVNELRHLEGFKGGMAVSESEYMTTTTLPERQLLTQIFYSNALEVVEQAQYTFNTFWNKAMPAKQRIKEIEENQKREFIETIQDSEETLSLISKVLSSATEEILIIFSHANILHQYQKHGILDLLKRKAQEEIVIRILIGMDYSIAEKAIESLKGYQHIELRYLLKSIQTKLTTIVSDRELSLVIEEKEDQEAIGLATYSNSESTVLSYASIFENLWIQSEIDQR